MNKYREYQEALDNITETNDVDERIKYRLTLQELVEKCTKLERENLGLKQTIKNLRGKEEKRYNAIVGSKRT